MLYRCLVAASAAALLAACVTPVYPARPSAEAGPPIVELEPTKVMLHTSATLQGLGLLFESALPPSMEGNLNESGTRKYFWARGPINLQVADGKVQAIAPLDVGIELPVIGRQSLNFELTLRGEPVISSDYKAYLQGASVEIKSGDMSVRAADVFLGVLKLIKDELKSRIDAFSFDLKPYVTDAFKQYASPRDLPVGDASACLALRLSAIEAGPTVLAGGFEKDIAVTVAPSVTIPCAPPKEMDAPPPLANVASIPTGAFTITVPVAASYGELAKAMTLAFTDGKLYISEDHPDLYITDPEVYASGGQLVLKIHLAGSLNTMFSPTLDGDIYFAGHPNVTDNILTVPDIEPTVDTSSFLLSLASSLGSGKIRDAIRKALVLDIGARLATVRETMSRDFTFADGIGCLRTDVAKIAVKDVFAHAAYLRMYVALTAQAGLYVPCPGYEPPAPPPPPEPGSDDDMVSSVDAEP